MIGEVNGKDIIDIGNIVTVKVGKDKSVYGRLNNASREEITVGMIRIDIKKITWIKKEQ